MNPIETYLDTVKGARLVRWPFRILAAGLVGAGVLVLALAIRGAIYNLRPNALLIAVVFLPLVALLIRTCGHAALSGHMLRNPLWPFASGFVAAAWIAIVTVVIAYVTH